MLPSALCRLLAAAVTRTADTKPHTHVGGGAEDPTEHIRQSSSIFSFACVTRRVMFAWCHALSRRVPSYTDARRIPAATLAVVVWPTRLSTLERNFARINFESIKADPL